MAPPDPSDAGLTTKILNRIDQEDKELNQTYNRDSASNSLLRNGSASRLVEDKHLGPKVMKQKVAQQVEYNKWNGGPGLPRAQPNINASKRDEDYEEDYEEGFEDAHQNNGEDEMDKVRKAMDREKLKAQKF